MTLSEQEQAAHVDLWQESGMSRAAYCREAGLRYHVFLGWVRRFVDRAGDPLTPSDGFIELTSRLETQPQSQVPSVIAEYDPQSGRCYVYGSADPQWAGLFVRELAQC